MTRQRSKKSYVMKPEVCAVPIYCNVKEEEGVVTVLTPCRVSRLPSAERPRSRPEPLQALGRQMWSKTPVTETTRLTKFVAV